MHFILYSKTLSGAYQLLPQIHAVNIRCQALVTPTNKCFQGFQNFEEYFIKQTKKIISIC